MKYIIIALLIIALLAGCSKRFAGEPYSGYSCRESIMHYYSYCSAEKLTKEDFEAKVQSCEKALATKVCDKEQVDKLWCMGSAAPEKYIKTRGNKDYVIDRCDCSAYEGALKECLIKIGIFDK
jgi:hypothetical protein